MSLQFKSMIDARPAAAKKPAAKAPAPTRAKAKAGAAARPTGQQKRKKTAKASAAPKPTASSWDGVIGELNARSEIPQANAEAGPAVSVVPSAKVALSEMPRGQARPWDEVLAEVFGGDGEAA